MASKTSTKSTSSAPKRKRTSVAPPAAPATMDGASMLQAAPAARANAAPTHEAIAFRAFELYQTRSYAEGNALNDWLTAERELRAG